VTAGSFSGQRRPTPLISATVYNYPDHQSPDCLHQGTNHHARETATEMMLEKHNDSDCPLSMKLTFVNREAELAELDAAATRGGLLVVFGRRRVGKTRLLRRWMDGRGGLFSQALEGPVEMQVGQVFADIRDHLQTRIEPRGWEDLLEILGLQKKPWVLCLDEFPYLVARDASLPSRLQRWLDYGLPDGCLLILSGSSMRMMHDLFLHRTAPLYGRAQKLLQVGPMDYPAFCRACGLDSTVSSSFEKFACVGGIPKYWEFVEAGQDTVGLAESLFFDFAPYMEQEPRRILHDEGLTGANALAVLEAVGRGATRAVEIASRLGTAQSNLSRLLQQLMDASVLSRDLPFGESSRTSKRTLYQILDPALRFWFSVQSPHRSLWRTYPLPKKELLIHGHAATVFEDWCRSLYAGAGRYWEKNLAIDIVAPDPQDPDRLLVGEVKWTRLGKSQREAVLGDLKDKWNRSALASRHPAVRFEVFDATRIG
jgi:AAA+ ATPase superfamily predicted ATPase